MKVTFKYGISGFTGTVDGNSIYFHKEARRFVVRRIGRFVAKPQNNSFQTIQRNLFNIHPSAAYKHDLKLYVEAYRKLTGNHKPNFIAWNNAWQQMMYEMQRLIPGIDLSTITRAQIYDDSLPCLNVASAVSAKLLPPIEGYQLLVNNI
jgi:hypothetical protein